MIKVTDEQLPPKVVFKQSACDKLTNTVGFRPAESGALLFSDPQDDVVQVVVFDEKAVVTRSTYTPDNDFLTAEIKRIWKKSRLLPCGIAHSHPGLETPSGYDLDYFMKLSKSISRETLITPIVFTAPDGGFTIHPFIFYQSGGKVIKAELQVISDAEYYRQKQSTMKLSKAPNTPPTPAGKEVIQSRNWFTQFAIKTDKICQITFNLLAVLMLGLLGWVCVAVTPAFIIRLTEILLS